MEVRTHRGQGPLQHVIDIGPHRIVTDAPRIHGAEERARLTDIANKCPVRKTLQGQIQIVTEAE